MSYTLIQEQLEAQQDSKAKISLEDPSLYVNREMSWIRFNERVLEEAQDPWHPLLERVKFLAICGSNLDEFFMTRVSRLQKKIRKGSKKRSVDGLTPFQQVRALRKLMLPLIRRYGNYWRDHLVADMGKQDIHVYNVGDLTDDERRSLRASLEGMQRDGGFRVEPLSKAFVHNLRLNLLIILNDTGGETLYVLEIPTDQLPRLFQIPGEDDDGSTGFVFIEDLVAENLDLFFPGSVIEAHYIFRLTRNAEIDIIMDESSDFLDVVASGLKARETGFPTRLQFERRMPAKYRELLANYFGLPSYSLFAWSGPMGLVDLWQLHKMDRPLLKDQVFQPHIPSALRINGSERRSIFKTIKERDILLYHPYDGFEVIIKLIQEAAEDPHVRTISITFYRIEEESPLIAALMAAARAGKRVTALIELRAKFDEEHNIKLVDQLRKSGVRVVYTFPGVKVHAKLCLIERRENGKMVRYSHIGSGNYHAVTTKIYGDTGYLTARKGIGRELASLFRDLLHTPGKISKRRRFKHLLVSPRTLKKEILRRIEGETVRHVSEGGGGYLAFKLNGLEDTDIVKALYRASMAGVKVDLNVRGLCVLRPGVAGISDNISVISIVGRFLEHARVYYFKALDDVLLGSSDMMFRNLKRRVEVLFSVPDNRIKKQVLRNILETHLKDNVKARRLLADGTYEKVQRSEGDRAINSQLWLIENRGIWHGP